MSDTQWPRYEVFKQDKPNRPHEAIGTVHATDAELALQNARDVHVRRPDCHSLWVAPETAILKVTAQQLEQITLPNPAADQTDPQHLYQIFAKQTLRRNMIAATHVGEIAAPTLEHALAAALDSTDLVADPSAIYVWWIVPDHDITRSEHENIASLFEPAERKTYKQQGRYGLVQPKANA